LIILFHFTIAPSDISCRLRSFVYCVAAAAAVAASITVLPYIYELCLPAPVICYFAGKKHSFLHKTHTHLSAIAVILLPRFQ